MITTASEATDIALKLLEPHCLFQRRPRSAVKKEDVWTVRIDVGLFFRELATVTIDAKSGEVLSYDIP